MRSIVIVVAGLALSGCAECTGDNQGNPDGMAYAGGPGSVYSTADNPPKAMGVVTYDPATAPPPRDETPIPNPSYDATTLPPSTATPRPR